MKHPEHPPAAGDTRHGMRADVSVRWIVITVIGLIVAAVVVQVGMVGLFTYFERRAQPAGAPRYPLAVDAPARPLVPPLQPRPADDMKAMREQQRRILYSYGWVDEGAGLVRIPIDRAMTLLLERGFPVRAGSVDPGAAVAPGASSGRMTEASP